MRLQGINGIQEIDASKEKQGESDGCTFLDSSKAVLENEATSTIFGCEKLQDKQEVVLCRYLPITRDDTFLSLCIQWLR